ncbi:hypothetical protein H5410_026828 [Solanum commersonii]|uniref:PPM-type phosphatase domain-containing protein n=1 Tax=Solanum commersonii TaxID=4109 RepID=A0A9J5Z010_SOLCO|nr:hypothetical protein H5410_026828 [Solanum commersonii]
MVDDECFILASDSLWDVVSSGMTESTTTLCTRISMGRNSHDNINIVVVDLMRNWGVDIHSATQHAVSLDTTSYKPSLATIKHSSSTFLFTKTLNYLLQTRYNYLKPYVTSKPEITFVKNNVENECLILCDRVMACGMLYQVKWCVGWLECVFKEMQHFFR